MRKGTFKKIVIGVITSVLAMCAFGALTSVFTDAECDHEWDEGHVTKAPTCLKAGETTFTCQECGEVKKEVFDPGDAAHDWQPGVMLQYATCKAMGSQKYDCAVCDATQERFAPLIAHDYEIILEVESTCFEQGEKVYHCLGCDEYRPQYFPPHDKADPDGDGVCDSCGIGMVAAEVGMEVVNQWFRLYRPTDYDPNDENLGWNYIDLSNNVELIAAALNYNGNAFYDYTIFDMGPKYSASVNSGLRVVITDEYIDFYFSPGVYAYEGGELSIAHSITIERIKGNCYKLIGYYEE